MLETRLNVAEKAKQVQVGFHPMKKPNPVTKEEALRFHAQGRPGKISVMPTKELTTQRDLSLAYSPGVAYPCEAIAEDAQLAYDYTAKGNLVAVISNGTAVLGLGDLGAIASKPVMEGKAVLFKKFADIDGIDLEVDTKDVDEFVNCVRFLGKTFGGINLEDIKAPECFVIEERLKALMDIPVFHDDQHGTAIITAAAMINALQLTKRTFETTRMVVNGAGAAAIACIELLKKMGIPHDHVIFVDREGVIYAGRTNNMNPWKERHANPTSARTLADALVGADVFLGLSCKGAVTQAMVKTMAPNPIIFAMANPDPEITPEEVKAVRGDAIMATGRSDYPNQVNNVLGFPYIFRGALDVRARAINDEMKIAAAEAIARLARETVPDEVQSAYMRTGMRYGPEYIIPVPFDTRLMTQVPVAVAKAAMETGVAQRPITDFEEYSRSLRTRLNPASSFLEGTFEAVRARPKTILFVEGENEKMIRAAEEYESSGYGKAILIGKEHIIHEAMERLGMARDTLEIMNASVAKRNKDYIDYLYQRLQRKGYLLKDCQHVVHQDRNVFAACMVAMGDADGLVTGLTRPFARVYGEVSLAMDAKSDCQVFGLSILSLQNRLILISDATVHEFPNSEVLAHIALQTAQQAKRLGLEPRVAFLSSSNFGMPERRANKNILGAIEILDGLDIDFEYDGEMSAATALDAKLMEEYPFCRLTGPANVLIMPGINSAHISSQLLGQLAEGRMIGPLLMGMEHPAQIVQRGCSVRDLVIYAALAAHDAGACYGG